MSENGVLHPPPVALLGDSIASFADRAGSGIRTLISAPATKDAIGEVIAAVSEHQALQGANSEDLERLQLVYAQSLWVYAAAFAIASNLSRVPLVAYKGGAEGDTEDDPGGELQALIDAPGPGVTRFDLVERITLYLKLTGNSFTYAERKSGGAAESRVQAKTGEILELRPLRTSRMSIIPEEKSLGGIGSYQHLVGGRKLDIAPVNIGFVKQYDPNDDYWGLSPIAMIANSIDVDRFAETWNKALVQSGGAPDAIFQTDHHLQPAIKRKLRHDWHSRFIKGHRGGLFVADDGGSIKPAGFSPKEMEFQELTNVAKLRILAAFGVPPLLVMDLRDASILANAETQERLFWSQTVRSTGSRIESMLTRLVRTDPRFPSAEGWGLRFDWSQVPELITFEDERVGKEHWLAGGVTLDEYRSRIGMPPVGPERGGDEFAKPAASPFGEFGLALGQQPQIKRVGRRGIVVASREAKGLARSTFRRLFREHFPKLAEALRDEFAEQGKRVAERAREAGAGKSASGVVRTKIDADDLLDLIFPKGAEAERLRDRLGPFFMASILDAGQVKIDQLLGESTEFEITAQTRRIRELFKTWGAQRVVDITEATKDAIRATLVESFLEADTNQAMQQRLLDLFQSYSVGPAGGGSLETRAERIARTESATALNAGSFAAAQEAQSLGIELAKSWLSSRDDLVRASHEAIDSETSGSPIPLDESFSNGLRYPNDLGGAASEVINCRCSMIEVVLG